MSWRGVLSFIGFAVDPSAEMRREAMRQLDRKLSTISHRAKSVEVSALTRKFKAETDPNREEMQILNAKRQDTLDAWVRGQDKR